jgi:hypothetical protein
MFVQKICTKNVAEIDTSGHILDVLTTTSQLCTHYFALKERLYRATISLLATVFAYKFNLRFKVVNLMQLRFYGNRPL